VKDFFSAYCSEISGHETGSNERERKKNGRHVGYERLFLSTLPIPSVCSYESSPYSVVLSSLVVGNCDVKILIYLSNRCTFVGQI
jgi:hypothetical protein